MNNWVLRSTNVYVFFPISSRFRCVLCTYFWTDSKLAGDFIHRRELSQNPSHRSRGVSETHILFSGRCSCPKCPDLMSISSVHISRPKSKEQKCTLQHHQLREGDPPLILVRNGRRQFIFSALFFGEKLI